MTMGMLGMPIIRQGVKVAEVGNLQRFLNEKGFVDQDGNCLKDDEDFGPKTAFVLSRYQLRHGIVPSAWLDDLTRVRAVNDGMVPFIQARNFQVRHPNRGRLITLVTIHTMEYPEKPTAAEDVALWFGGLTRFTAPIASAHYCVDQDSTVQCVRDWDIAWHAGKVNDYSIGVEHDGYAKQSARDWADVTSEATLKRSARLVARICTERSIPVRRLTHEDLLRGERLGLCGHVDVSKAWPHPDASKNHWDPGPNFPWEKYLGLVRAAQGGA